MSVDVLPIHQIAFGFGVVSLLVLVAWLVGGPEE